TATQASAGATGSGPTVPISHSNVLPNDPFGSSFLPPSGSTTIVLGGTAQTALIQPGTDFVQNFDAAQGGKLDLTKLLAGAPLAPDLANIGSFVQVSGQGPN